MGAGRSSAPRPGRGCTMSLLSSHGSERKIICVDMDEVIADALGEHLLRYNRDFNEKVTAADLHGRWLWDYVPPERLSTLERYIRSEDFFADLRVMPHAQRVLERLQERFEVYIATAAMEVPTSFTAKFEWLKEHFPFIRPSHIVFWRQGNTARRLSDRRQPAP